MTYKATVRCFSEKNQMAEYKNFRLYIDSISYPNTGRFFETEHSLKGKRHMYALVKGDSNKAICSFLNSQFGEAEEKSSENREIDDILCYINEIIKELEKIASGQSDGEQGAVIIYVEDNEVYAGGFGNAGVYTLAENGEPKSVFQSGDGNLNAVHIGKLGNCGKYLMSVSPLIDGVSASCLERFFSDDSIKAMDAYEEVSSIETDDHFVAASVNFEKEEKNFGMRMIIACVLILAFAVLSCVAAAIEWHSRKSENGKIYEISHQSETGEGVSSETDMAGSDGLSISDINMNTLDGIKEKLDKIAFGVSDENTRVSYCIKNLTTGEALSESPGPMYAANMINLYVVGEIYRQFQNGELARTDSIDKMLESATLFNDYESANELIRIAGGSNSVSGYAKVTDFASSVGCTDTILKADVGASDSLCAADGNLTSADDCALLLEKIYNGALVSAESSDEIHDLLSAKTPEDKILKYIPQDGVISLNKTGEALNVQNDAAIICTDKYDYIFCVMINDFSDNSVSASEVIAGMSKCVYEHFVESGR